MPHHPTDLPVPTQSGPVYIYALVDPFTREFRYVGKTDNPSERLKNHCNDRSRCHRTNWIRSVVARGARPIMVILQRVPHWAAWQTCERMWIDHAIWNLWPITNSTSGGDGTSSLSPESRAKISRAMKGRELSPEHRAAALATLAKSKGRKLSHAERARRSERMRGVPKSEGHKRKTSLAKRKLSEPQVRVVLGRLANGESQSSVARAMGVSQPTISAIARGHRKYTTYMDGTE